MRLLRELLRLLRELVERLWASEASWSSSSARVPACTLSSMTAGSQLMSELDKPCMSAGCRMGSENSCCSSSDKASAGLLLAACSWCRMQSHHPCLAHAALFVNADRQ